MIHGKRVTLRSIERDDLEILHRYQNDLELELMRAEEPPQPQSFAKIQNVYEHAASRPMREDPWFAIDVGGSCIGTCGLHRFDITSRNCAIGIGIGSRDHLGKGYGKEAIQMLLWYGFQVHNLHKIWLCVTSNNHQAIKSYHSCGFVEEGRFKEHVWFCGQFVDLVQMGLFKEQWQVEAAKGGVSETVSGNNNGVTVGLADDGAGISNTRSTKNKA